MESQVAHSVATQIKVQTDVYLTRRRGGNCGIHFSALNRMLAIRLKRTSSIEPEYKLVGISVINNCGINEMWHPLIFRRDFHLFALNRNRNHAVSSSCSSLSASVEVYSVSCFESFSCCFPETFVVGGFICMVIPQLYRGAICSRQNGVSSSLDLQSSLGHHVFGLPPFDWPWPLDGYGFGWTELTY